MTISARRAALLGLTVPLSAIMNAVLGLWPEPEEDEDDVVSSIADALGGGDGRPRKSAKAAAAKPKKRDDPEEDKWLEAHLAIRAAQMRAIISLTCAIAEEEYA